MLSEGGITSHSYLFIAGVVVLIMFLIYVYLCEHKVPIEGNSLWATAFQKVGLIPDQISNLAHDDNMWYIKRDNKYQSTCVAYGDDLTDKCYRYENYCAGGDRFGSISLQAQAVKEALNNGGEHPLCPLVYPGAA